MAGRRGRRREEEEERKKKDCRTEIYQVFCSRVLEIVRCCHGYVTGVAGLEVESARTGGGGVDGQTTLAADDVVPFVRGGVPMESNVWSVEVAKKKNIIWSLSRQTYSRMAPGLIVNKPTAKSLAMGNVVESNNFTLPPGTS